MHIVSIMTQVYYARFLLSYILYADIPKSETQSYFARQNSKALHNRNFCLALLHTIIYGHENIIRGIILWQLIHIEIYRKRRAVGCPVSVVMFLLLYNVVRVFARERILFVFLFYYVCV